jgi:membrane protein CcdC involved in cytochrome C biogenesis
MVSAIVAVLLAATNLIAYLAGAKTPVADKKPGLGAIVLFTGIMLVCAGGMWKLRYWAVLGFQTLLAVGLLGFSLALIKAKPIGVAICIAVIVPGGYLFYKLVRVLGRIQMPTPPRRR